MAVTCREFVESAKGLCNGEAEIDWRNSASRAYYGSYHSCFSLSQELPPYADLPGGVHQQLISALQTTNLADKSREMSFRSLGYKLQQCRAFRTRADYDVSNDFPKGDAEVAIGMSEGIIDKAEGLNDSSSSA